jgi:hypothetical protein
MQTNGVPEDLLSFPEVIKTKQNDMRAEARKDVWVLLRRYREASGVLL